LPAGIIPLELRDVIAGVAGRIPIDRIVVQHAEHLGHRVAPLTMASSRVIGNGRAMSAEAALIPK